MASGWVSQGAIDEVFSEKEKKPITIKIKKPGPKLVKPGNWKEPEAEGGMYYWRAFSCAQLMSSHRGEET